MQAQTSSQRHATPDVVQVNKTTLGQDSRSTMITGCVHPCKCEWAHGSTCVQERVHQSIGFRCGWLATGGGGKCAQ
eukprot:13690646-Alexandrium_andersonii.AAC.1